MTVIDVLLDNERIAAFQLPAHAICTATATRLTQGASPMIHEERVTDV